MCFSASVCLVDNHVSERQMNSCDDSWRYSRIAGILEWMVWGIRPLTLNMEKMLNNFDLPEQVVPSDSGTLFAFVAAASVGLGRDFVPGAEDAGAVNVVPEEELLEVVLIGSVEVEGVEGVADLDEVEGVADLDKEAAEDECL